MATVSSAIPAAAAQGQVTQNPQLPALKQLTLEELLELDVTLPLRREERVMDAPAAIAILTNEDLRRQGAVSLPDALRHVPGVHVARVNASSAVVASRGFAGTTTNKMLVMIDGRSVYSPLFSGVFWNQQDVPLLDVDRVEIIRGAGASLWGSNAVNGVINVVSRAAAETQGFVVSLGGGAEERLFTTARYGGRVGAGHYRIYGKFFDRGAGKLESGGDAADGQRFGQGGFRIDLGRQASTVTLQGDVYRTAAVAPTGADLEANGTNVLARWTRRPSARSELQLQAYVDRTRRAVPSQVNETRTTFDIDVQQRYVANSRHTFSAGASYRRSADATEATPLLAFEPASRATSLVTAFAQSEFAFTADVSAIAGVKIERNDYTGVEWQPSGRLRWRPTRNHTVWGAVSRAVRMPTRFDTDVRGFQGPVLVFAGNPDFRSESLVSYEAGYRMRPGSTLLVDLAAFHNRYDDLRTWELERLITFGNALNNNSTGATVTTSFQPRGWLRLTGAYTRLAHRLSLDDASRDIYGGRFDTVDPDYFARLQARVDLPRGVELDVMSYFVGALPQVVPQLPGTPAFTEASVRIGWQISPQVAASVIGRDVLNKSHVEFIAPNVPRVTRIERAIFTQFTIGF